MTDGMDEAVSEALSGVMGDEAQQEAPEAAVAAPEAAPPVVAPPQQKASLDASRALAARAAKEREFRQQEASVRKERADLDAYKSELADAREMQRLLKEDPNAFLEKSGVSFEQLGADLLSGKRVGVAEKAMAEIESLKARLAERDAQEERRNVDEMYDSTKHDISDYVTSKASEYDLVNAAGAHDLVFEEVQAHYEETGDIDVDGAAQRVEAYLESISERLSKSQKARKFFPGDVTATTPSKTLTNNSVIITKRDAAPKTHEELMEAAIAQLGN